MSSLNRSHDLEMENTAWRQRMVSELFHMVSQPLTGLHCLLEVSLLKRQTAAGYRRDLESALENTSRLVEALRRARELAEADDPGQSFEVNAAEILREVSLEFMPLLDAMHSTIDFALPRDMRVRADAGKLRRACFIVLDDVLHDLRLGGELLVGLEPGSETVIYIGPRRETGTAGGAVAPRPMTTTVEIAKRSLEAMGGSLRKDEGPVGPCFFVTLPGLGG